MEGLKKRLEIENITKTFVSVKGEEFETIRGVSFGVRDSEFLVPLGSGLYDKTVLLNILTGLGGATPGTIRLGDQELKGCSDKISMVSRKLGLFSQKTVMENVGIGLKYTGVSKREWWERAQKSIDLVGLTGFKGAYPERLSGGTKQKVGIARAYTVNPGILILDESFSQLDAQTRYSIEGEILYIWKQEKRAVTFATNSIKEAAHLGDRIILLEKCPTSVKEIYDTDLSRPRNTMGKALSELRTRISDNTELSA